MECRVCVFRCFFFFKQKTAYEMRISDGSADVCSSDLVEPERQLMKRSVAARTDIGKDGGHARCDIGRRLAPRRNQRLKGIGKARIAGIKPHPAGLRPP